jgi:lysophospholipase L1-like esterase
VKRDLSIAGVNLIWSVVCQVGRRGLELAPVRLRHHVLLVPGDFWYYVDVDSPTAQSTIVAFGDSITDGYQSIVGANDRWPDFLAQRIEDQPVASSTASWTRVSAATGC